MRTTISISGATVEVEVDAHAPMTEWSRQQLHGFLRDVVYSEFIGQRLMPDTADRMETKLQNYTGIGYLLAQLNVRICDGC